MVFSLPGKKRPTNPSRRGGKKGGKKRKGGAQLYVVDRGKKGVLCVLSSQKEGGKLGVGEEGKPLAAKEREGGGEKTFSDEGGGMQRRVFCFIWGKKGEKKGATSHQGGKGKGKNGGKRLCSVGRGGLPNLSWGGEKKKKGGGRPYDIGEKGKL